VHDAGNCTLGLKIFIPAHFGDFFEDLTPER